MVVTITVIYGTPTVCTRYLLEALRTSSLPHNSSVREVLCSQTGKHMLSEMGNDTTPVIVTTTPTIPTLLQHTPYTGHSIVPLYIHPFTLSLILAAFPRGNLRILEGRGHPAGQWPGQVRSRLPDASGRSSAARLSLGACLPPVL